MTEFVSYPDVRESVSLALEAAGIEDTEQILETIDNGVGNNADAVPKPDEENETPTLDRTVEELIDDWLAGVLTLSEGNVRHQDNETIAVKYEGTDGFLEISYTLAEELSYRSDTETATRFNILARE